jgi:hypothetical protein
MNMNTRQLVKRLRRESGQILVLVLILLVVGSLILVPLIGLSVTNLKIGQMFDNKARDYYAADAGVEDALWHIKYDHLNDINLFTTPYDVYGFDVLGRDYKYQTPLALNNYNVDVNIANVWMPSNIDPSGYDLEEMVETAKLIVLGQVTGPDTYRMTIIYRYELGDSTLHVNNIGLWLPPGFSYLPDEGDTCDLEDNLPPFRPEPPEIVPHAGGTALVWEFQDSPIFVNFPRPDLENPPATPYIFKLNVNLTFHPSQMGQKPDAIGWIVTEGLSDCPFAWDADVKVFRINSKSSGGTEVVAYAVKTELRKLARTIPGDYKAIGNSLLTDDISDNFDVRETWHTPSSATVSDIPVDAEVAAAYLYWSGWKQGEIVGISSTSMAPLSPDTCANFNNWTPSGAWSSDGSKFTGHYVSGNDPARYLTLKTSLNSNAFSNITVTWQHGEDGSLELADKLQHQVSWDNGTTWSGLTTAFEDDRAAEYPTTYTGTYSGTPVAPYNFLIRFFLAGFADSGEYCFLDDVTIIGTFSDAFANLNNWTVGSTWDSNSDAARGWTYNKSSPGRYLEKTAAMDFSAYAGKTVTLAFQYGEAGYLESSDILQYQVSWNGGSSWNTAVTVFADDRGSNFPTLYNYTTNLTVPASAPQNLKVRFYIPSGAFNERDYQYPSYYIEYAYVDNLSVKMTLLSDNCANFDSWNPQTTSWFIDGSARFGAHYLTGGDPARYLSLTNSINLSAYATQQVVVSWDQYCAGTLEPEDALYVSFSDDGGTFWSDSNVGTDGYPAAMDDVQAGGFSTTAKTFSITIPSNYLTAGFKMRFYINSFADSGEYCYIDNITLKRWPASFRDEASYAPPNTYSNWASNGAWTSYYNSEFIGHAAGNGYIGLSSELDLSTWSDRIMVVQWKQAEDGTLEAADKLKYQFSGDGGANWSELDIGLAFADDMGSNHTFYDFDGDSDGKPGIVIPSNYLTNRFKMRFYLEGFAEAGEYCYIQDIMIYGVPLVADTTASLNIDGTRVYFDADGLPQQGTSQQLMADWSQVIINNGSGNPPRVYGYGYSSFKDVTALVRAYCREGSNHNRPGNGTYSVGDVDATRNDQLSYAGWSLIIIYTSMATQGHFLYLYDTLTFAPDDTNIDMDRNGTPGTIISGFIVPEKIIGEIYSAQITVFVGEGDEFIGEHDRHDGDYLKLNGRKLWDGITCNDNSASAPNNAWNSRSAGMSFDGVDVDTFKVRWDSYLLSTGDTQANLDLSTEQDNWNLIYIIVSFRSETTVGGTLVYCLK